MKVFPKAAAFWLPSQMENGHPCNWSLELVGRLPAGSVIRGAWKKIGVLERSRLCNVSSVPFYWTVQIIRALPVPMSTTHRLYSAAHVQYLQAQNVCGRDQKFREYFILKPQGCSLIYRIWKHNTFAFISKFLFFSFFNILQEFLLIPLGTINICSLNVEQWWSWQEPFCSSWIIIIIVCLPRRRRKERQKKRLLNL